MSHTTGPWVVVPDGEESGLWVITANEGRTIIAASEGSCRPEVEYANAALIAAAPEMLDALKAFRDLVGTNGLTGAPLDRDQGRERWTIMGNPSMGEAWQRAYDAITKATGGAA